MGKLLARFGTSRKEIWRKLSAELDARYIEGTWRKSDRVEVEHGPWTITLDAYTVMANNVPLHFTRMRAPFANREQLRMRIYRSTIFSGIGKWLGMQDIEVGSLQFDKDFIVQGSDEHMVRRFCGSEELRRGMLAQKTFDMSVKDDEGWFGPKYPAGSDVLGVTVSGHLTDPERIRALFDLFSEALEQLCAIGVAYENKPGMTL